jgi:phage repressor protein C with HTH and peptisase S24 domain
VNSQSGNAVTDCELVSSGVDGNWLQKQLQESGRSQVELARYLNLAAPIINKIIKGRRAIKAAEADQIRAFFRLQSTKVNSGFPQPVTNLGESNRDVRESLIDANITTPLRSEMPRDIPILGTVSGGPGGLQMNGDAIDWARRPPRLKGRTDVFGLWVEDISMVPAYRPGALILVERARPPSPGDDVVVEIRAEKPGDDPRALIKHLVALTATTVKLLQHNPSKELEIPRKQVIHLYRVIPLADLLGV